jgi:hypothetical protein
MQFSVLASTEIAEAPNETASALLRPCSEAVSAENGRGINMIMHKIAPGLDALWQEAAVAISSFKYSDFGCGIVRISLSH